jgi:hypothetical protein
MVNEPAPRQTFLHAMADGPALGAVMKVWGPSEDLLTPNCWLTLNSAAEGKYVLSTRGNSIDWSDGRYRGAIGGDVEALAPTLLFKIISDTTWTDGWIAGDAWLVRHTTPNDLFASHWDTDNEIFVASQGTDPELLDINEAFVSGNAIFWTTNDLYRVGLNSWNETDGARPFIRYIGDATRGAGNLGTDGTDLVWSEGEGKQPTDTLFPTRHIMTAPFTTDPNALQPKRLRSDPAPKIGVSRFGVGCGFAAHGMPVAIVRISDGYSWVLPDDITGFGPWKVLGIDCTHVYLQGMLDGKLNIARIELASLGPPLAPD